MHLAPHIAVADFGDRAVILDIWSDRYRLVGARKAAALAAIIGDQPIDDQEALEAIRLEGMLGRTDERPDCRPSLPQPVRSALEMASADAAAFSIMSVARATLEASVRLKATSLRSVLAWAQRHRRRAGTGAASGETIIALAQSFDRLRTRIPLERICLRDSLALHTLLRGRGADCALVFGVRLDPFGAHCWVQAGEIILSDTLGAVRQMRTILWR